VLLRMLAFKPQGVNHIPKATLAANVAISDTAVVNPAEPDKTPVETAPEVISETIAEATSETIVEAISETPTVEAVVESHVSEPVSQAMVESSQEVLPEQENAPVQENVVANVAAQAISPEPETTVSAPMGNTENNHSASQAEHHDNAIPSEYEAFANMPNTEEDPSVKKSDAATEVAVAAHAEPSASVIDTSALNREPPASQIEPIDTEKNADVAQDEPYLSPALAAFDAPAVDDTVSDNAEESQTEKAQFDESTETVAEKSVEPEAANDSTAAVKKRIPKIPFNELNASTWFTVYKSIDTGGLLQSTVANCALINWESLHLQFILDHQQSTLYDTRHQQYLADLLTEYFGHPIEVTITLGDVPYETPSQIVIRQRQERQVQAEEAIANDPVVQQLQEMFDGKVVPESIKPID